MSPRRWERRQRPRNPPRRGQHPLVLLARRLHPCGRQARRGAGAPDTWPEPYGYGSDDQAPGLMEVEPGHFVRCAA